MKKPSIKTWNAALNEWVDSQRGARTRRDYRRIWERFASYCAKRPWDVTAEDVAAWKGALEQDGYALSTLRTSLATLRSFYTFACQRRLRADNPVPGELLPPSQAYLSVRALSQDEEARLLGAIDRETAFGRRDYALALFLLRTGRSGREALDLRWGDLQVDKHAARYTWTPQGKAGQGGERCTAELDWDAWTAIWQHLKGCGRLERIQADEAVFAPLDDSGRRAKSAYGPAWRTHALSRDSLAGCLKMYARWAGLDEGAVTPKTLRNTAALRSLQRGCSLQQLQALLGLGDLSAARKARQALLDQAAQPGLAYRSQRRRKGGQPGNQNGAMVGRYLLQMFSAEGLRRQVPDCGHLHLEIRLLRMAIFHILGEYGEAQDFDTACKLLNVLGAAAWRVACLIEVEWRIQLRGLWDDDSRLEERLHELYAEEGDLHIALDRWAAELIGPGQMVATDPPASLLSISTR